MIPCSSCNGTKVASYDASRPCYKCEGRGEFPDLDVGALLAAIVVTRGARKGQLRKSMTAPYGRGVENVANIRAYYVWRMARFHGGADVTMPWTASTLIDGDPTARDLDRIADAVAKRAFGTDRAAMHRWGSLLGFAPPAPAGLPATAYEGGPVHDGNDPETAAMLAAEERNRG